MVGSAESYSGKSATILGIALQLIKAGLDIAYGKPLETCTSPLESENSESSDRDDDVQFIAQTLQLDESNVRPTVLSLNETVIQERIGGANQIDYQALLSQYLDINNSDCVLLEGPGTLAEGQLFGLSLQQAAHTLDAKTLVVARYHSALVVESILETKRQLGDRLLGVLINDVPDADREMVEQTVCPFLESQGIPVFGVMPRNAILRPVSLLLESDTTLSGGLGVFWPDWVSFCGATSWPVG
ncbi:MAG: phosphotransacetylase family protein [Okeania sp. SIO2G5]|nr:phosphotransacetylase family protein [Okeania sp. SIO2G5]